MKELTGYNITQKEFQQLSHWTENAYNITVVLDYFCKTQPEIEELYNLTPIIKTLTYYADMLNAFFINHAND